MNWIKKTNNKLKQGIVAYYPLLLIAFVWLMLQLLMQAWTGDEFLYADLLNQMSLPQIAKKYYMTWSSRILWDMLGAFTHHYPLLLFKLMNTAMIFLEMFGILLLIDNHETNTQWFVGFLLLLFPYVSFYDCGFTITSLYYIWPAVFMLYALIVCIRYPRLETGKSKCGFIIAEIVLTTFAADMEQYLVILLGIQLFFFMMDSFQKKINICTCVGILTSILVAVFTFSAPGKENRIMQEIGNSFPEYGMLSFLQKINIGFSTTMKETVLGGDATWLVMTGMLVVISFGACKNRLEKMVCMLPFGLCCLYGPGYNILSGIFPYLYKTKEVGYYGVSDLTDFDQIRTWVPLFIMVLFWVSLLLAVWLFIQNKEKLDLCFYILIPLLVFGLLSRVALGFSPTIYASGNRTFYPLWLTICIVCAYLFTVGEKRQKTIFGWFVGALSFISFIVFASILR